MHNNKRFAFGVLDNEVDVGESLKSNGRGISRRESAAVDNGNVEVEDDDDDRLALIPRNKAGGGGGGHVTDNDAGRRLSRDELNEVSEGKRVGMDGGEREMTRTSNETKVCQKLLTIAACLFSCTSLTETQFIE